MNFEEYKRKLLEEDERERLSELQCKYHGIGTPNYSNMSLHDQLQTRFDLNELNYLQNKYGVQQTPVPQSTYTAPTQPAVQQPTPQPQNSFWQNTYNKINQMADTFANDTEGAVIAFAQGLSGNNFDELTGATGAAIVTDSFHPDDKNIADYNKAYKHIRDDIRTKHNNFKGRHQILNEALEIGGTILGGTKKPYTSAILYGIGSAETPKQIPEEIMYNALGNKYARKVIPTSVLPKQVEPIAQEYFSRKIPELLKDYNDK